MQDIRESMDRATRFITLSGISGISTGIIALAGISVAYNVIFKGQNYLEYHAVMISSNDFWQIVLIGAATLIVSLGAAIFFTNRKTKLHQQHTWTLPSRRFLINILIPLVAGGILSLLVLIKGFIGWLCPLTLMFYGLALINASKYTLTEIRTLGIIEIILGLIAFQFIEYSLLLWALGFGFFQIVYGILVYKKY